MAPTFLGQAPPLAVPGLPVQQLALGAARGSRGCTQPAVPSVAEGVAPTRVPGRGLPKAPLDLGPQPGLLDAAGGCARGQPVAIDLVQVLVVLVPGPKGVAQVRRLCWDQVHSFEKTFTLQDM